MEIAVIGTGYVGLVTGVCLAEIGNNVTCIDIDDVKIEKLKNGEPPIYEEGLEEILNKNILNGSLTFTSTYSSGLSGKSVIYIAVGTPQGDNGAADLKYINAACEDIARNLTDDVIIVTKSTVPVGTNELIKDKIKENLSNGISISMVSNPEFLRQGSAIHDTFNGDRIIIGSQDEGALKKIEEINRPFETPIVKTDLRSAEMIKYASNAFLATKISFINEIANLCEKVGANVENVSKGMGLDARIGKAFLNAGIGYGGSCFPKDTKAIVSIGKSVNCQMSIIENTDQVNIQQQQIIVNKVNQRFDCIKGKRIALLGLAFKPNTDDLREAPSIIVSQKLIEQGAHVHAYDPVAVDNARKILPNELNYTKSIDEALENADLAIILTDWKDIKEYKIENYVKQLRSPIIFDGRNCLNIDEIRASEIEYHSIGRPVINGDF